MVLVISLLTVLLTTWLRPREPFYQGKALSYWVKEMHNLNDDRAARQAVHQIGPRGIHFLMSAAAREDSVLRRWYRSAWPHLPDIVQQKLPKPEARIDALRSIANAYAEIGPPAIPALTTMLQDRDGGVRVNALIALAGMRGDRTSAVPVLIGAITNSDHGLESGNPWVPTGVRRMAATVLGQIGQAARTAIPVLTQLRTSTNAATRAQAALALWRITDDAQYISTLTADLEKAKDIDAIQQNLDALGEMGPAAIVALPAIRRKFQGQGLDGNLMDALLKIDPDAILKADGYP